jgi:DNA-binding protein HU-beta
MENKINFSDLVEKVALETGASKQLVHDLLIESVKLTKEGLDRDGLLIFKGLGRFKLKWHEARNGRNPQTGEEIEIGAHSTVHYKPEMELREYINRKNAHLQAEVLKDKTVVSVEPEKDTGPDIPAVPAPKSVKVYESGWEPVYQKGPKEKNRYIRWLWVLVPLIVLLLLYIFWPAPETDIAKEEAVTTRQAAIQPVTEVPTEQPAKLIVEESPVVKEESSGIPAAQHIVTAGQNLWLLAEKYYSEGNLWPNIYRVNNERINNPDHLISGIDIQIPGLNGQHGSLSSNDLQDIARGYLEVYLVYNNLGKEEAHYFLWVAKEMGDASLLEKYIDKIDREDLKKVEGIKGSVNLK